MRPAWNTRGESVYMRHETTSSQRGVSRILRGGGGVRNFNQYFVSGGSWSRHRKGPTRIYCGRTSGDTGRPSGGGRHCSSGGVGGNPEALLRRLLPTAPFCTCCRHPDRYPRIWNCCCSAYCREYRHRRRHRHLRPTTGLGERELGLWHSGCFSGLSVVAASGWICTPVSMPDSPADQTLDSLLVDTTGSYGSTTGPGERELGLWHSGRFSGFLVSPRADGYVPRVSPVSMPDSPADQTLDSLLVDTTGSYGSTTGPGELELGLWHSGRFFRFSGVAKSGWICTPGVPGVDARFTGWSDSGLLVGWHDRAV